MKFEEIKTLCVGASILLPLCSPSWSASGQLSGSIETFLEAPEFVFVPAVEDFRFAELVPSPASANTSTHILIDGIRALPNGGDLVESNYRGVNLSDQGVHDVGRVYFTMPEASGSSAGVASPIVGIVRRDQPASGSSGWSAYEANPLSPTTLTPATRSINFDNSVGTLDIIPNGSGTGPTGSLNYSFDLREDGFHEVTLFGTGVEDRFTLSEGESTYAFASTMLIFNPIEEEFYGILQSTDEGVSANSRMFALRIDGRDADADGIPDLIDVDTANFTAIDRGVLAWIFSKFRIETNPAEDDFAAFLDRHEDSSWAEVLEELLTPSVSASSDGEGELDWNTVSFEERIIRLYAAFGGRVADGAGLDYWTKDIAWNQGWDPVVDTFVSGAEYDDIYGDTTDEEFLWILYDHVFNREPDTAGLNFWLGELQGSDDRAPMPRNIVLMRFSQMPEMDDKRGDMLLLGRARVVFGDGIDDLIKTYEDLLKTDPASFSREAFFSALEDHANLDVLRSKYRDEMQADHSPENAEQWAQSVSEALRGEEIPPAELTTLLEQFDEEVLGEAEWVVSILSSPEFQRLLAPVYRTYQGTYGRAPEAEGLFFWANEYALMIQAYVDQGMSESDAEVSARYAMTEIFMEEAPEFEERYGNLTDEGFVEEAIYRNVLRREPDASGRDFWVEELNKPVELDGLGGDRVQLLLENMESPENLDRLEEEQFAYLASIFIGPFSDEGKKDAEYPDWLRGRSEFLNSGGLRVQLVQDLLVKTDWRIPAMTDY